MSSKVRNAAWYLAVFLLCALAGTTLLWRDSVPRSGGSPVRNPGFPDPCGIAREGRTEGAAGQPSAGPPGVLPNAVPGGQQQDNSWSALVLVYPNSDFAFTDAAGNAGRYTGTLTNSQVASFQAAARNYPDLVRAWSGGQGRVRIDVRLIDRPITTLSEWIPGHDYWPTPADISPEIDALVPGGDYDSVIVLWNSGTAPTDDFWGLSQDGVLLVAGREITYATVRYAEDWLWTLRYPGEVILHEWLHGLSTHYRDLGYSIPDLHANYDYGYAADADLSLKRWYSDYMQGKLTTRAGECTGMSAAVWRAGSLLRPVRPLPCQALRPLNGQAQARLPLLKWSPVPADRYQVAIYQQGNPVRPVLTLNSRTPGLALPAGRLRAGVAYTWTLFSSVGAATSPPGDTMSFVLGRVGPTGRLASAPGPARIN